jgi:hypothetical protein
MRLKLPLQQSDKGMVKSKKRVKIKWSIQYLAPPAKMRRVPMGEEYEEGYYEVICS